MSFATPLKWASNAAGWLRPLYLPLGVAAIALVGLHRGADRLDDLLLGWLGALDGWLDAAAAAGLGLVGAVGQVAPAVSDEWALAAAGIFPMEAHAPVARAAALVVELVAAALVAVPLIVGGPRAGEAVAWDTPASLRPRLERASLAEARQEWLRRLARIVAEPSLRKLALPAAVVAACVAGAIAAGGELEAQLLAALTRIGLPSFGRLAQLCGWLGAGLIAVQLAPEALVRAIAWADERGRHARAKGQPRLRRLAAGVFVAGIALPVALAGLHAELPLETFHAALARVQQPPLSPTLTQPLSPPLPLSPTLPLTPSPQLTPPLSPTPSLPPTPPLSPSPSLPLTPPPPGATP